MEIFLLNDTDILWSEEIKKAIELVKEKYSLEQTDQAIRIANLMIKKSLDQNTIIAALLQTGVFCNKINIEDIRSSFGKEPSLIVTECSTIKEVLETNYKKITSETLSALTLSIATDLRTIIILMAWLADSLKYPVQKNNSFLISITKNIFYPLTIKLGISELGWQMADYSFKLENPNGYAKIKQFINKTREAREQLINDVKKEIETLLKNKIKAQVFGRPKNFLSIYEKNKKTPLKSMHDIYGIRIICNKEKECYEILGEIHSKYNFIPQAFDDYITKEGKGIGKEGYQSLHTAITRQNDVIEIQIRTWEQHLRTESSIYWEYKRLKKNKTFDKTLSWERQLIEWQASIGEENKSKKLISGRIFVFTPKNEVITLPEKATALDFAFAVHSDVGERIQKAKVNGEFVPLETKLHNLDHVEIIINEKSKPKRNWMNFVVSEKARTKIKKYFGIKTDLTKKQFIPPKDAKRIKLAECCHPLPGEDVIGVKTTKRKIIIHKRDCENLKTINPTKLVEIFFEQPKGSTKIKLIAIDRIGLLAEILNELKRKKAKIISTDFKIKETGYVEATFDLEVNNINTLNKIISDLEDLPSIQKVERK
ncbi:MAG: TGS domain-containing protein [archaeon]|jgi:GTP pyrophosphokinase